MGGGGGGVVEDDATHFFVSRGECPHTPLKDDVTFKASKLEDIFINFVNHCPWQILNCLVRLINSSNRNQNVGSLVYKHYVGFLQATDVLFDPVARMTVCIVHFCKWWIFRNFSLCFLMFNLTFYVVTAQCLVRFKHKKNSLFLSKSYKKKLPLIQLEMPISHWW